MSLIATPAMAGGGRGGGNNAKPQELLCTQTELERTGDVSDGQWQMVRATKLCGHLARVLLALPAPRSDPRPPRCSPSSKLPGDSQEAPEGRLGEAGFKPRLQGMEIFVSWLQMWWNEIN